MSKLSWSSLSLSKRPLSKSNTSLSLYVCMHECGERQASLSDRPWNLLSMGSYWTYRCLGEGICQCSGRSWTNKIAWDIQLFNAAIGLKISATKRYWASNGFHILSKHAQMHMPTRPSVPLHRLSHQHCLRWRLRLNIPPQPSSAKSERDLISKTPIIKPIIQKWTNSAPQRLHRHKLHLCLLDYSCWEWQPSRCSIDAEHRP